jgi:hypothetical protein
MVGPYLTTNASSKKKKKSAKQLKADAEHAAWLKKRGLDRERVQAIVERAKPRAEMPKYEYKKVQYSNVVGSGTQSGVMANLANESPQTRKEILNKAKRIAPAYSKGAYQYITPKSDLTDIGKKK